MIARLRAIRDELGREWEHLTWDEILQQLREGADADPMWQRWVREGRAGKSGADRAPARGEPPRS